MSIPFTPPRTVMEHLLVDHATGRNIIWATDDYAENGHRFHDEMIMRPVGAKGVPIMPRVLKGKAAQTARARNRAEVSTPAWICRAQLDAVDKAWEAAHAGKSEEDVWYMIIWVRVDGDSELTAWHMSTIIADVR